MLNMFITMHISSHQYIIPVISRKLLISSMPKLCRSAFARPKPVKINDYVDILLANMAHFIIYQGMDPVPMPDVEESFEWVHILGPVLQFTP